MTDNFVACHWNGSEDGWVECGPYVHDWFETRERAEAALAAWRSENAPVDGWRNRSAVLTAEEYYAS